jgi:hypothetical protein
MMRRTSLVVLLLVAALVLPQSARAGTSDLALFSASAGSAIPNIMFLMDTSSSMIELPGPDDDDQDCDESGIYCKWEMARDVLLDVVSTINYPDGEGGYVQNARFGVFLFDKDKYGGRLIIPIANDNTGALLSRVENMIGFEKSNADINSGTPLGPALVDVGRYFAGAYGWGTLPKFGTLDMQITPSISSAARTSSSR